LEEFNYLWSKLEATRGRNKNKQKKKKGEKPRKFQLTTISKKIQRKNGLEFFVTVFGIKI